MPAGATDAGEGYSSMMGLMYVFNLIVGTGALAMPKPIAEAGWLLSLIILIVLAFMSFVTVTFVTETMAAANALVHSHTVRHLKKVMKTEEDGNAESSQQLVERFLTDEVIANSLENEKVPLLLSNSVDTISETSAEYFNITERIEMGKMALLFFNRTGVNIFYVCIAVYLYGDLAIYAAAVSKSLRDVSCTYSPVDTPCNISLNDSVSCWASGAVTRGDTYRIFLAIFLFCLGPFAFFNVQKTKYLQIFTTIMRWLAGRLWLYVYILMFGHNLSFCCLLIPLFLLCLSAFSTMIITAAAALIQGKGRGHPSIANVRGVPNLFGVCVYSFMCHHSLPSLITPIRNKSHLLRLFIADYLLILLFYCLLSFTGIFTFEHLLDIYTLNFEPQNCNTGESILSENFAVIRYFLTLFPVFTLSTNFPIIAITLRNNLKSIFLKDNKKYSLFVDRLLFPLLAVIPPVAIAFITADLTILVGITGSYAGAAVQYVVPALLVYYARKDILASLGLGVKNKHASPFKHAIWIWFVLLWALMCTVFVTVDHIIPNKKVV